MAIGWRKLCWVLRVRFVQFSHSDLRNMSGRGLSCPAEEWDLFCRPVPAAAHAMFGTSRRFPHSRNLLRWFGLVPESFSESGQPPTTTPFFWWDFDFAKCLGARRDKPTIQIVFSYCMEPSFHHMWWIDSIQERVVLIQKRQRKTNFQTRQFLVFTQIVRRQLRAFWPFQDGWSFTDS